MNRRAFLGAAVAAVLPAPATSLVVSMTVEYEGTIAARKWAHISGQPFTGTVYETRPNDGRGFAAKHPDCVLARTQAMDPRRPGPGLRYPARWTLLREVT